MVAEHFVLRRQMRADADRDGLFADTKMGRATHFLLLITLGYRFFDPADAQHSVVKLF